MSLLDSYKKGLTILSAFFLLFACEEPTELPLGISPKQGNISSHVVEIPIEAVQLRVDSVLSSISRNPLNTSTYIGKMTDSGFGTVKATAYTNIGAPTPSTIPTLNENVTADSVILKLKVTPPLYGSNFSGTQILKIYNLPEPIDTTTSASDAMEYVYYTNDKRELLEEYLIGEVTFDTTDFDNNDVLRFHLNETFAAKIVEKLKQDTSVFHHQQAFDDFIGSLAFEPGEGNTFLANYNFTSNLSEIELYYPTASNPANVISFPFAPIGSNEQTYQQLPTYYSLETDYSGTALEGIESISGSTDFQTADNQVYFRSGVGLLPKITFPSLEEIVNSIPDTNVVINSAVLEVDSVQRTIGQNISAPAQMSFYFVEPENNTRFQGVTNETYAGAQLLIQPYVLNQKDSLYRYRADIADEIEWVINTNDQETRKKYLQGIVFHGNTTSVTSLSSLVADPQRMVLKIYYTTLEKTDQEN